MQFYCLHALADGNQRIRIGEKMLEFFPAVLFYTVSIPQHLCVLEQIKEKPRGTR